MGFGVEGLGSRFGFGVWGLGFGVLGFRVSRLRLQKWNDFIPTLLGRAKQNDVISYPEEGSLLDQPYL